MAYLREAVVPPAVVGGKPIRGDVANDGRGFAIVLAIMALLSWAAMTRLYGWRFWRWPWRDFLRWW